MVQLISKYMHKTCEVCAWYNSVYYRHIGSIILPAYTRQRMNERIPGAYKQGMHDFISDSKWDNKKKTIMMYCGL